VPITLSALDPKQVSSASSFEVLVGEPGQRLLILSGIAIPEFWTNHDEELHQDEIEVKLGVYVASLDEAVAHVGLASIENAETNFVFNLGTARVEVDGDGQLVLRVWAAILGEETLIHRFGYQVVAHVHKVAARISGTILVPKEILDMQSLSEAEVAGSFDITANRIEKITSGPFLDEKLIPVGWGATGDVRDDEANCYVDYAIDACPFNISLKVQVKLQGRLTISGIAVGQVAGPDPVILTTAQPDASGVDFSVGRLPPIR
jgi:hypothetical protein